MVLHDTATAQTRVFDQERAEAAIRELHPYELPAIHAVAVVQAFGPYAEWVEAGSAGKA